jgi:FkbM family methyltransferase
MKTSLRRPNRLIGTAQRYQRLVWIFSNWPTYFAAKWGWSGRQTMVMRTRAGLEIEIPWPVQHAFKEVFLYQSYVHPLILAGLPERPVILDVGGNVGFFSLFALHLRPQARCFTFEPMKGNFAQLQRNRTRNSRADWRLFQAAMADIDGTITMHSPSGSALVTDAAMQHLRGPVDRQDSAACEQVAACSLETVLAREGLERCDWLKLDCEGAEYQILYRTDPKVFDRIRAISMETHRVEGARNDPEALTDFLENVGYDVWLAGDMVYALKAPATATIRDTG